ncbi:DUF4349 domain-containing protein [Paenibacillus sp. YYML68]|uniref:DUF4349 domain-containing protein n=1 Tax=Paenibacillus sp. YYML68 TaxID=2909250 RepID=UPI002490D327|nr:DUF4349 domain-containing protein [Paenibacillus sp. YYML68]
MREARRETGSKLLVTAAALALLLSGCGADGAKSEMASYGGATATDSTQMKAMMNEAANTAKQESPASAGGEANTAQPQSPGSQSAQERSGGFNGQTAPQSNDVFSRKIMYRANLTMQVDSYDETETLVQEAVRMSGGYVLTFNESSSASDRSGSFIIKVPASGFTSLLAELEKINPSMRKSMEGQDVTEEFVDLSSRLKAKELVELRLVSFMEKATKAEELVAFSAELGKVQEEIERIKGRMRYLEQNVAYSTIDLRITEKIGSADVIRSQERGPLWTRASDALNGSIAVLSVIMQGAVVLLAGALPIIVLCLVVGLPVWWMRRRRRASSVDVRRRLAEENKQLLGAKAEAEAEAEADSSASDEGQEGAVGGDKPKNPNK